MSPSDAGAQALQGEALVDRHGWVWLPYDLSHLTRPQATWTRLSSLREVRHFDRRSFEWRSPRTDELQVLNGMGVTLGDSIIGMNALAWLKAKHPQLRIRLYRTPFAPTFVARLYELSTPIVERVSYLPVQVNDLPRDVIDLSDFLYWPAFNREPMVDFFFRALGLSAESVPARAKSNHWLAQLQSQLPPLPPAWRDRPFVLLCDRASTPLRSVPPDHAAALVDRVWRGYGLPVCGFHAIDHPHFHDISSQSRSLDEYLTWVRHARAVVGVDSSAIHIAAGFDVPTLAFFTSIDPALRVRDYPHCHVVDLRTPRTDGLHQSDDTGLLADLRERWLDVVVHGDIAWPAAAR